ncbi:MAG TPA: hypothetical protein VFQ53_43150 [Kofleriaceae bacterium]|nr:hypothetical protein [Kofleriaceae bacterium]
MRRALLLLALGACSPSIASATYLCGPEELCPEGQKCNGVDNTCVVASDALPFACDSADQIDETPAQGQVIDNLSCVSILNVARGCLTASDAADWYQFDIPDNCAAVQIEAKLEFPIAYEPLALQLASEGGAAVAAETPCGASTVADEGEDVRCFEMTVPVGTHHALGVVHTGTADCDGACANNRYTLSLQLATP